MRPKDAWGFSAVGGKIPYQAHRLLRSSPTQTKTKRPEPCTVWGSGRLCHFIRFWSSLWGSLPSAHKNGLLFILRDPEDRQYFSPLQFHLYLTRAADASLPGFASRDPGRSDSVPDKTRDFSDPVAALCLLARQHAVTKSSPKHRIPMPPTSHRHNWNTGTTPEWSPASPPYRR